MATAVSAPGILSPSAIGEADLEDSNASSPLSEFDDGDANDEDIRHMQINARNNEADNSSLSADEQQEGLEKQARSESESALSDAGFEENSEANDTEAETERLYDTPRHQRQRDVIIDQYNDGQVFEHTPSKLRTATGPNGDGFPSDDEGSAASVDDSSTKHVPKRDTNVEKEARQQLQERKRKRSPLTDQSESDQPLRKRLNSVGGAEEPGTIIDTPANDDAPKTENFEGEKQSSGGDLDATSTNHVALIEINLPEKEIRATERSSRNGVKGRKTRSDIDSPAGTPRPTVNGEQSETADDEDTDQRNDDAEAGVNEQDPAAKSIEEAERKEAAFRDWTHIEEMFGIFRDRLYKDRIQRLEEEEQSLLADVPTHPEYLNMRQCLDNRLERKVHEIDTEFTLRLEAHERRAIAIRAQVWSQFFQAVRERREAVLESLNQQWYEVQTARRSAHSLPDYGLLFPKDQLQRVRNAIAYNTEVSTLSGLAKYEGFPAGPELKGASVSEAEADFSTIEQVRRDRQKTIVSVRDEYPNPSLARLGPAGEQFIKDTPWANPHHSAHKLLHQTPNATNASRPDQQTISSAAPTMVDTRSATDSQIPSTLKSRMGESPEMSRSIVNPASHQMRRVASIPNIGRGSKAAAA